MNTQRPPSDWPPDDPVWRALGRLPEAQLPPGFARRVVAAAARPRRLSLGGALQSAWEQASSALAALLVRPRAALAAAAAVALLSASLIYFKAPIADPLAPPALADMQSEEDFDLINNLDVVLSNDEAEQWLYASLN